MKPLSEFLSGLKRLFVSGDEIERKGIDPRKPIIGQMVAMNVRVTSKSRRRILRRLAAERRHTTRATVTASRQMSRLFSKRRLVRAFTMARAKRVAIGTIVTRMLITRDKSGHRRFTTKKFKALKHGKLVAA